MRRVVVRRVTRDRCFGGDAKAVGGAARVRTVTLVSPTGLPIEGVEIDAAIEILRGIA